MISKILALVVFYGSLVLGAIVGGDVQSLLADQGGTSATLMGLAACMTTAVVVGLTAIAILGKLNLLEDL